MTIWDSIRKGVGQVAADVSRSAEGLKIQTDISAAETELERVYAEAGKRAQELWRERKIVDADLDLLMRQAGDIEAQLDELRRKSFDMQGPKKPVCPQCKQEVAEGVKFCGGCGAKVGE